MEDTDKPQIIIIIAKFMNNLFFARKYKDMKIVLIKQTAKKLIAQLPFSSNGKYMMKVCLNLQKLLSHSSH